MGNTSLHSRLAQALAKAGSFVPEESSPFGAKPIPPRRYAPAPDVPRISNVADLIAEDYIAPTYQGAKAVGGFVREHPAETAAGIAAGFTLPVSVPGVLGAGALGIAGRMIDKTHPLTDEKSDYKKQSSKEIAKDLLISGTVNALGHGIFGPTTEAFNPNALGEAVVARGPIRSYALPEDEAGNLLFRTSSADPMYGVSPHFDPRELDPTINLRPYGARVDNPNRNALLEGISTSDKKPLVAMRYVADDIDPLYPTKINPRTLNAPGQTETELFLGGEQNPNLARSYHTFRSNKTVLDKASELLDAGNHPEHSKLEELYWDAVDNPAKPPVELNSFLEKHGKLAGPKYAHSVEIFPKKLLELDYNGHPYDNPTGVGNPGDFEPEEYYGSLWDKGYDAVRIRNVRDPGNRLIAGSNDPGELIVVAPGQHGIVQSPFGNYTGTPNDLFYTPTIKPQAIQPTPEITRYPTNFSGGGLGAGIVANQRQE